MADSQEGSSRRSAISPGAQTDAFVTAFLPPAEFRCQPQATFARHHERRARTERSELRGASAPRRCSGQPERSRRTERSEPGGVPAFGIRYVIASARQAGPLLVTGPANRSSFRGGKCPPSAFAKATADKPLKLRRATFAWDHERRLVRPARLERATSWFVGSSGSSILLILRVLSWGAIALFLGVREWIVRDCSRLVGTVVRLSW